MFRFFLSFRFDYLRLLWFVIKKKTWS